MNDAQIIQSAYADALGRLFAVFFETLATAGDSAAAEPGAAAAFQKGVALARSAREQALQVVQQ